MLGMLIVGCSQVGSVRGQYEGYGDFSDVPYFDIDWYEVTRLEVQCANDNGMAVRLLSSGDGWTVSEIQYELQAAAISVVDSCQKALHLPKYKSPTRPQLEELYAYNVAVLQCLESQGYSLPDPPSVEVFVESKGAWNPYHDVPIGNLAVCPQQPVGGFGAWDPGDPIKPALAP